MNRCYYCGGKREEKKTTFQILTFLKQSPIPIEIIRVPAYDLAAA